MDNDLISRAAAIAELMQMVKVHGKLLHYTGIKAMLEVQPAVDAVPMVHGKWQEHHTTKLGYGKVYYQHSCTPILYDSPYYYCPNCGARMDRDEKPMPTEADG